LECRPTQITQVLLNLLNNARDAAEESEERWVQLDVTELADWIRISVTDSGKGIPVEIREKIMSPFFTTKAVGKGTGLGLSITKSIVDSHRGTLILDEESVQTRFVIELPKRQPQEAHELVA
jgi:signal transduction histidine kinase